MKFCVNFVVNETITDEETLGQFRSGDTSITKNDRMFAAINRSAAVVWCAQTYWHLQQARPAHFQLQLSKTVSPGCINVIHGENFARATGFMPAFGVLARGDWPTRRWAQSQIVQNPRQTGSAKHFIPNWPHPGLIPRPPTRGGPFRVAFFGKSPHVNLALSDSEFRSLAASAGAEFVMKERSALNDYSDVDVAVGIRSFDGRNYDHKPPSKLINAWHAGVPFIGGADSAFSAVGRPGVDYLVAHDAQALRQHLVALRTSPDLYRSLVEAGRTAATDYTVERISKRWLQVLEEIADGPYRAWQRRGLLGTAKWYALRAVGHGELSARATLRRTRAAMARR